MPTRTRQVWASTAKGRRSRPNARARTDVAGAAVTIVSTTSSPGRTDLEAAVTEMPGDSPDGLDGRIASAAMRAGNATVPVNPGGLVRIMRGYSGDAAAVYTQ